MRRSRMGLQPSFARRRKRRSKSGCTLKNFNLDSNTLTLTMVCAGTTTRQETKFHGGDSFETTTTNTVDGVTKVTQIKSRRTGDCSRADTARILFALQNSLTALFQSPRQVGIKGNNNNVDSTPQGNHSTVRFIFKCHSHQGSGPA